MIKRKRMFLFSCLVPSSLLTIAMLIPLLSWGQNLNSSISGQVTDPSGAVVPNVQLTLRSVSTGLASNFTSGSDGLYTFQNLQRGAYELRATATGFQDFVQTGISVNINETLRLDVKLTLGSAIQTVEVTANASPLNFENASVKQAITPNQVAELPLLVSGMKRNVVNYAVLMPGVTTGANNSVENSRVNGGMVWGDESTLDGVTMQEGLLNQSGMISFFDMPIAPEVVDEISIVASTYEPQYGMTTSAVYVVTTKSGTSDFHGGAYEYNHNTDFNSRPFGTGDRPKDNENDFGVFIGGPAKIPKVLWDAHRKTYFFFSYGGFRSVGTVTKPIYSFPTMQERSGDFSDYPYPIYDPATTAPLNPGLPLSTSNVTRQQFMGCNGNTPNVICASDPRLAASLAQQWLANVPQPNRPGILNNYEAPVGVPTSWENQNRYDIRVDHYIGSKDHIFITEHYGRVPAIYESGLPFIISTDSIRNKDHYHTPRVNWDHTISPTLLNHWGIGYLDWYTHQYDFSDCCVSKMPQIPGVWSHTHQPQITFDQYSGYGNNGDFTSTRPEYAMNDMVTWVHGRHTLKTGAEYRYYAYPQYSVSNGSGTFSFTRLNTGLPSTPALPNSGNDMASFLLGYVGNASAEFYTATTVHPMDEMFAVYAGDTFKATPKLSVNYGLRWDLNPPSKEKENRFAFFDPNLANPDAGGLLGAEVFAGSSWGPASFGRRYPENVYYHAFAPRIGIAYSLTPKTVVRTGYGIFFDQAFYPGWAGGIGIDGFNENVVQPSSFGGLTPSFLLQSGFPQNFTRPPNLTLGADNGLSVSVGDYRPFDANRLPYAQQWNLTVEHQFTQNFYISAAYVGNKGTRLPSAVVPLNVLNPSYLSWGSKLNDTFSPGQTTLDGVNIPYAGWVQQMRGCNPTVGQALLPFPQYCGTILGDNENAGNSTYHSFQFKAERRFAHGTSVLLSYTNEKTLTDSNNTQSSSGGYNGVGQISPYQRWRNKALSTDDVPQTLSAAVTYGLPFGRGQRFLANAGPLNSVVGGWTLTSVFRLSSGVPLGFYNSACGVPGYFGATCLPATGSDPFNNRSSFNPNNNASLFNLSSFQTTGLFPNGYFLGSGPPTSNLRGFGFYNHDVGLLKEVPVIGEHLRLQLRAEFFNIWNWHSFENNFTTDVSNASFGVWNGSVSNPRNIQFGAKLIF